MGKVTGRPTGVRLTKRQTENCRAAIQATSLINRLQDNANGKLRDKSGNFIEMTNGQVRSADILLNKALPNLQATVHDDRVEAMTDADLITIATGGLKSVK